MKQRHIVRRMSGFLLAFIFAFTLMPLPGQGSLLSYTYDNASISKAYAADDTQLTALQLEEAIEAAQLAYTKAVKSAEEAAQKVTEQEKRITLLEKELLPEQQERAGLATREMYKFQQNGISILSVLLGANSLSDFVNQLEYVTRVTDKQHNEIIRLVELKQELQDSREELKAAQEEAEARVEETREALDAAKEAQAEAQRRIEEDALLEAALAANGGHLVDGERTNDIPTAQQPAPATQPNKDNENTPGDTGNEGENGGGSTTQEPQVSPPPASSDSLDGWAARIDAYLAGSPLAGQGRTFASAALAYGVDPRFSPAIACTESGKGRYCFLPYNAWGWGSVSWGSWEEAIDAHVRGLASLYGYTVTVEGAKMYCPPNWEFWYNTVSSQMALI